jgi:tetrahydrodipicolinate N-succinyltransferase
VVVLPGVTLGRGVTVGAGSVVTKDVLPFHCVAGNPAHIIREIEINAPDPLLDQTNAEGFLMVKQATTLEKSRALIGHLVSKTMIESVQGH